MVNYWQGGNVTLDANSTGSIRLRIGVNGEITHFFVYSDGLCEVQDIELSGYEDIFEGVMVLRHFRERGYVYTLPEPIPVTKGQDFVISLKDLSGSSNKVYFAVLIKKAR